MDAERVAITKAEALAAISEAQAGVDQYTGEPDRVWELERQLAEVRGAMTAAMILGASIDEVNAAVRAGAGY